MTRIAVSAACIVLGGCAGSAALPPQARTPAPEGLVAELAPNLSVDAAAAGAEVIELAARDWADEPTCRKAAQLGSRIVRETCYNESEAEALLNEQITRADFEYMREWALMEEQRRMQQALAAQQAREQAMQSMREAAR